MSQDVMDLETKLQSWAESARKVFQTEKDSPLIDTAFLPSEDLSACYKDSAVCDSLYGLLESAIARSPADQSLRFLALSIFYQLRESHSRRQEPDLLRRRRWEDVLLGRSR